MNFPAEYQPPAEYDTDSMDEVDARWALLKLNRWERVAVRCDELQASPEGRNPEIVYRIQRLRRNYQAAVGIAPDERSNLRRWLSGFLPAEMQAPSASENAHAGEAL